MKTFLRNRGIRLIAALAIAAGTAGVASLTALSTTQASADPASVTGYVGVGADVTQDFYDSLSGADGANSPTATFYTPITSSSTTDDEVIDSYDAFPSGGSTVNPGCITTKFGGPSFDRPNSSTAGIGALYDAVTDAGWENSSASCTHATVNVEGEIDFARSARGPKTSGSTLTFIPYGRDGLGILVYSPVNSGLDSLSTANLQTIYSSTTGTSTIGGDAVEGCLTITGSTPRSNLESAIGVSDTTAGNEAALDNCNQIQQNSGNAFYTFTQTLPANTGAVIPISSGAWIAQANGRAVDESNNARTNGFELASITDGTNGSIGTPETGTAPNLTPVTKYYSNTDYGYNLYTVLPTSKVSGENEDFGLASLFVGSGSALCSTTFQNQMHNDYGFDVLSGSEGTCGTTTQTGNG